MNWAPDRPGSASGAALGTPGRPTPHARTLPRRRCTPDARRPCRGRFPGRAGPAGSTGRARGAVGGCETLNASLCARRSLSQAECAMNACRASPDHAAMNCPSASTQTNVPATSAMSEHRQPINESARPCPPSLHMLHTRARRAAAGPGVKRVSCRGSGGAHACEDGDKGSGRRPAGQRTNTACRAGDEADLGGAGGAGRGLHSGTAAQRTDGVSGSRISDDHPVSCHLCKTNEARGSRAGRRTLGTRTPCTSHSLGSGQCTNAGRHWLRHGTPPCMPRRLAGAGLST